jgi:hypothetical protein
MNVVTNELASWLAAPEPEAVAMCFNPRHAVRVLTPKHTYDFIVCFECGHAEVYVDSSTTPAADLFRSSDQDAWDALLSSAKVKLAPRPLNENGI